PPHAPSPRGARSEPLCVREPRGSASWLSPFSLWLQMRARAQATARSNGVSIRPECMLKRHPERPQSPVFRYVPSESAPEEELTLNRILAAAFSLAVIAASALIQSAPIYAAEPSLSGTVTDIRTGQVVANVCVTVGPPVRCATSTKADGTYFLDMTGAPNGIQWDVRFLLGGQIKAEFLG